MFETDDTIVAIATPPGRGSIGVVRISGPDAPRIAARLRLSDRPLQPRHATLTAVAAGPATVDRAVVIFYPAPHSYTGEDVVEISAHGSPVLLTGIVATAVAAGARVAEPGEFTFRAFLRGRIDLVQAEAVRDLVHAVTPLQARAAYDQLEGTLTGEIGALDGVLFALTTKLEASLDFPEEGYHFLDPREASREMRALAARIDALLASAARGRLVREGLQIVIAGRPNTGKSSLFNRLAGAGRAIVTDRPGTTRDLLTETIDVEGIPVTLVDTAGLHTGASDPVEIEGIARALAAREVAAAIMIVLDRSAPLTPDDRRLLDDTSHRARIVVVNKIDVPAAWTHDDAPCGSPVEVSARTGEGMDALRAAMAGVLAGAEPHRDVPAITNVRHVSLLAAAREAIDRAAAAAESGTPEEFVLADLIDARGRLEEVTGARTPDDVLEAIFSTFCIGK